MNADLEKELREHSEFMPIVDRLQRSMTVEPRRATDLAGGQVVPAVAWLAWRPFGLVAASLLVALSVALWRYSACRSTSCAVDTVVPYGAREYHLTADEMIATQNPDGSWQNDFLTRRNAMALRDSHTPAALIAYKKAVRYLRTKGLPPRT